MSQFKFIPPNYGSEKEYTKRSARSSFSLRSFFSSKLGFGGTKYRDKSPQERAEMRKDIALVAGSALLSLFVIASTMWLYIFKAPRNFPVGVVVRVEEGMSLADVAHFLAEKNVISAPLPFMALVRYQFGGDATIQAGEYFFSKAKGITDIARRITTGDYGLVPFAVTIPEGVTVEQIGEIISYKFESFDSEKFVRLATPLEGYLFPDTYYFLPNVKPEHVIEEMNSNFRARVAELSEDIEAFGMDFEDIIIMASIVEKEGEYEMEARQKIAGVLWRRIEIDMPLQVDAVFPYIIGKNTFELTLEDLGVDNPYNTYKYKGLPPTPIANPGLMAIEATVHPIESNYLFYLADRRGRTHFAETYEQHLYNKRRYLD